MSLRTRLTKTVAVALLATVSGGVVVAAAAPAFATPPPCDQDYCVLPTPTYVGQVVNVDKLITVATPSPARTLCSRYTSVAPKPVATISNAEAWEGGGLRFTVQLDRAPVCPVAVSFQTHDLTATAPADYAAQSGSVLITGTQATITVPTVYDGLVESTEYISMSVVSSGVVVSTPLVIGTIRDNTLI